MTQTEIFGNAQWIGAPEYYVRAENMGVFAMETRVVMKAAGSCVGSDLQKAHGQNDTSAAETCVKSGLAGAGIIFGDDDYRLNDRNLNELGVDGENYFAMRFCAGCGRADGANAGGRVTAQVIRAGYTKDVAEEVLWEADFQADGKASHSDGELSITESAACPAQTEQAEADITLNVRLELLGNRLNVIVNGNLLNEKPVVLNPLGENDVTTFPRMNRCGFFADENTAAHFEPLRFYFLREPKNQFCEIPGADFAADLHSAAPRKVTFLPDAHSLPQFRRAFFVGRPLRSAELFITARGIFDAHVNGNAVSNDFFAPGASQFDKHLYVRRYDITTLLRQGKNAMAVMLAGGWWCGSQTFVLGCYNLWGDKESFIARLVMEYEDGTKEEITTDTSNWQYFGEGALTFSGFFQGERLDGRRISLDEDFSKSDFEKLHPEAARQLKNPVTVTPAKIPEYDSYPGFFRPYPAMNLTEPDFLLQGSCPVRAYQTLGAITRTERAPGFWIYDLGQEIAGISKITFRGTKGEVATIRYAEMLYPSLPEYGTLAGMPLVANLRDASSTDHYILNGSPDGETFTQKFTFHGFRYIEISGVKNPPECSEVQGILLSSIPKITGKLKTGNALLDRFVKNVTYGQLANFISIPTDCPQRNERMGWAGDTHVFCKTALFNANLRAFYEKYLLAMRDLQDEDGNLPEIAPVGGGFGGITYGSALLFITNDLYDFYGDKKIIAENYDAAKRYIGYLRAQGLPGAAYKCPIDDWLAPEHTESTLIWNAFYARDCFLAARFATELGLEDDAAEFTRLWEEAKSYYIQAFCTKRGIIAKKYRTTGALAITLAYNLADEDGTAAQKTADLLAQKVRTDGFKITTGFFCTGMILPALSRYGHAEEAYRMMTSTDFPSWLYPVTQGATTVWERWDSFTQEKGFGGNNNMNSFNHYSFGCVVSWLYEHALGIRQAKGSTGWKKIVISPDGYGFDGMEGGFETPLGRINLHWHKDEQGKIRTEYSVPDGVEVIEETI